MSIEDLKKLLYVDINSINLKVSVFVINFSEKIVDDDKGYFDYNDYEEFVNDEKINDFHLVEDNPVEIMKNKIAIWVKY